MRKLALLSVLILVFAVPTFAVLHIGVSGGYSYASFTELNDYWNKIKADAENYSNTLTANWKDYGPGVFGNVDLNFNVDKSFLIGVRSGVQYVFSSTFTGSRELTVDPGPVTVSITTETTVDNILVPIMAGFSYVIPLSDSKINLRAEAYGGWGLGYYFERTSYEGSPGVLALYGGGGFMADVGAAVEFAVGPFFFISINGAFRYCKTSDYKSIDSVSASIPGYGTYTIPTNDPFNDQSGKPVAVDFTGFNIGAGINIRI